LQVYEPAEEESVFFENLREMNKLYEESKGKSSNPSACPKIKKDMIYTFSEDENTLLAKFSCHLEIQRAKGKARYLAENTRKAYFKCIYSRTQTYCLSTHIKKLFGNSTNLTNLLMNYEEKFITLDEDSAFTFCCPANPGEEGSVSASVSSQRCSALMTFVNYLRKCAVRNVPEPKDSEARGKQTNFLHAMDDLSRTLSSHLSSYEITAKKETTAKRKKETLLNPKLQEEKKDAYARYIRKGHYNRMLTSLCEECQGFRKNSNREMDPKLMRDFAYWLMANIIYINGSRRQAAIHFKNIDFFTWQNANVKDIDHYSQIIINRDPSLEDYNMVQFVLGFTETEQLGKTSADIELSIPVDLCKGLVYYYFIKKCLGFTKPEDPFFVDIENKPVKINNFFLTYLYSEMCHEMGVKSLKFVEQRHVVATNMLASNPQGKNTGMGQGRNTQETRYNDLIHQEGIRNKLAANSRTLAAPVLEDQGCVTN
jgi:hypothetical protein